MRAVGRWGAPTPPPQQPRGPAVPTRAHPAAPLPLQGRGPRNLWPINRDTRLDWAALQPVVKAALSTPPAQVCSTGIAASRARDSAPTLPRRPCAVPRAAAPPEPGRFLPAPRRPPGAWERRAAQRRPCRSRRQRPGMRCVCVRPQRLWQGGRGAALATAASLPLLSTPPAVHADLLWPGSVLAAATGRPGAGAHWSRAAALGPGAGAPAPPAAGAGPQELLHAQPTSRTQRSRSHSPYPLLQGVVLLLNGCNRSDREWLKPAEQGALWGCCRCRRRTLCRLEALGAPLTARRPACALCSPCARLPEEQAAGQVGQGGGAAAKQQP